MDRLPDELIRHISDYGGLYTAKNIADTSRTLANVYNVPGLVDEIQSHRASMEECRMYEDTLREVDHVMQMIHYMLFSEDPNISSYDAEDMLLNYDPMWFTLSDRMQEKAEEYMDTLPYTDWVRTGHYGPDTHAYMRAKACANLLNSVAFFMNRFETWVKADMHSRDRIGFRTREMKGLEVHIPDIKEEYNTVKNLLDRCIEARPESTSRNIYSFGRKSRRPTKGKRAKKHRYALRGGRDMINRITQSIVDDVLPMVIEEVNSYNDLVPSIYHFFKNSFPQGEEKTWVGVFGRHVCENSPFSFYGPLNTAILALNEHLYACNNVNNQGTIEYWINETTSPLALSDMIYDFIYDLVARGKDIDTIYRYIHTRFSKPAFTHTLYTTIRTMFITSDIARLE